MYEDMIAALREYTSDCGWGDENCSTCSMSGLCGDGFGPGQIADAIEELQKPRWHMITTRPMDDDERKEWSERLGYALDEDEAVIYGNLPDEGERVLVVYKWGSIGMDKLCQDEGCYFEDNGEMDGIIAWMPLPEPPERRA